ncbi:MAG: Arsenical pump-driving ATPase TEMP [uncultured Nocardioidaceae bacterium]|uniref:Arsenical pump-driving ATPase TEMP n=1 Tax=uncultured Nocardioidaceae bacterium TaxID=253824 RepID=A0A6J4LLP1_9ACTN|nr:MAG: Arsenical pump-driving ATPase TEMP [uncultured Nocardioidaceae bacterium]
MTALTTARCVPQPGGGYGHTVEQPDWGDVRLHVVTGKGGTGKTTVAAALALALAWEGRQVLLCEVEGRQGVAGLFGLPPLGYDERRVATGLPRRTGDRGGDVHGLAVDAESAMLEYLALYYRLGNRSGKALERFGVLDFATTVAPGLRDVLLTGKVFEAVERNSRNKGARVYDAVVLDAPPTGRIAQFLGVNGEFGELARVGPVRGQTDRVMALLRSRRTAVHLVTVLEEMPVQETADGIADLERDGLPVGGVVVNLVQPAALDDAHLERVLTGAVTAPDVAADLQQVDLGEESLAELLLIEGREHAERHQLEEEQRAAVAALGRPTYELVRRSDGVGPAGLHALAADLRRQGMA